MSQKICEMDHMLHIQIGSFTYMIQWLRSIITGEQVSSIRVWRSEKHMQLFKYSIRPPGHFAHMTGVNRSALVIVLCGLLCMIGTITLGANASSGNPRAGIQFHPAVSKNTSQLTSVKVRPSTKQVQQQASHLSSQNIIKPFNYPVYFGNAHISEIALTFDDGPNPIYTPQVLTILRTYKVKATFFDVGYLVKDFPNIVRQEFLQGDSIGNHSWSHPELTRLSAAGILSQLVSTSNAIQSITGVRPTIFRPPYGTFNRTVVAQAIQQNLTTILWDNEGRDWATPGTGVIVQRILNLAHNGSIILMHDGGGFRSQTIAALPIIITALRQRGFTFVTIPQLLQDMTPTSIPSPSPSPSVTDASSFATIFPAGFMAWKQE